MFPSSSSAPTSIVKPYPRLSSFCPFAVPPVSPSLLCPCNASPLFSMAFVAGAALPMTRQRPARATCTMSAGGGEKKSLGQWLLEKINHNFDEDFGYEVFLKKAMTAKDVEERKRNEEEKKAKK